MTAPPKDLTLPPECAANSVMDAITDILRIVGLVGGVFVEAEQTGPWAVAGQLPVENCSAFMDTPQAVVAYHFVVERSEERRVGKECRCVQEMSNLKEICGSTR